MNAKFGFNILEIKRQIELNSFERPKDAQKARELEKAIVELHNPKITRQYAETVEHANIPYLEGAMCDEFQKVMHDSESRYSGVVLREFVLFAKNVKGANIRHMERTILNDTPVSKLTRVLFASNVRGANIRLLTNGVEKEYFERVNVFFDKVRTGKITNNNQEYIPPARVR